MKNIKKIMCVAIIILPLCSAFAQISVKIPELKKSPQLIEEIGRAWETALADLNGDGYLDLVITSLDNGTRVLFNNGKGYFEESKQELASGTHGIAVGDLDNDGDNDLFLAKLSKDQSSAIYLNNGKGFFDRCNTYLAIDASEQIKLIDIDNDGDLDAHLLWRNLLYINDGKGNFSKSDQKLPMVPFFSDLNNDGCIDIIAAEFGKGFTVFLNDQKGAFFEYSFLQKNDLAYCYLGFCDIDNDKDCDIIYSNGNKKEQHPAGILLNDGTGKFTESGQKLSTVQYGFIGTGDLNNDGWTDIILTDNENPSRVWLNEGNGKFVDSGISLGEGGLWNNCIINDIDNDGDMDIFVTKVYKGSHGIWFNQFIN